MNGLRGVPPERERVALVMDLIAARHFHGVWVRGQALFARKMLWEDPYLVHWEEVRRIVEAAREAKKKPPASAQGARRANRARKSG
jgi:hypothetical protein